MQTENSLTELWLTYNESRNEITRALGRTSNIVCEFSELLVAQHYGGKLLAASSSSADIVLPDGRQIQVKARIPRQGGTTSLGVIRSWDFDLLVAVIFNADGTINRTVELDASDAKRLSVRNDHQNGWVITTTNEFYRDPAVRDITDSIKITMPNLDPSKVSSRVNYVSAQHGTSDANSNHSCRSYKHRVGFSSSQLAESFRDFLSSTSSPKTGMKYSPNTVSGYVWGIKAVCKEENCTWEDLAPQIDSLVFRYSFGGDKYEVGEKGKKAVINALGAYQRFTALA